MDQKEIKSLLKTIKENIEQKDYKTAIRQCKSILKIDRNNYLALVFYGAAVQETDQKDEAPKAFKKAIDISPEQLLAWRGLASYYEKKEMNDLIELQKIYARLLILETDKSKLTELIEKFEKLALSLSDTLAVKLIYDSFSSFSDEKKTLLQHCLTNIIFTKINSFEDILGFSEAEENALKAISLLKNGGKVLACKIKLLQCLSGQSNKKKLEESEDLGKELYETNPADMEVLKYLINAKIRLGKYSEAEEKLKLLSQNEKYIDDVKYLKYVILKHSNKNEDLKKILEELVLESPDYYKAWLELGRLYYSEMNIDSCLISLLKSAKLNQWCYKCFLLLGHCYKNLIQDLEKARRCYQKAFQLNPFSEEIGINLSDLYKILEKPDLNMQLLSTVTALNPKSKWAWVKLGLFYLSINQQQDAVNSLRMSVRLDPNDKNAWECLGDIYFAQNAHTSALKSYQRVLELDADSVYSMLQIARIKHLIGLLQESVQEFRLINERISDCIPALKGHAEACLAMMRQYLIQNLNGLAHDFCQEAVNSLIKCLQQKKDLICIWKLLGDSAILISTLPEKYCKLKLNSWLPLSGNIQNGDEVILDKCQILKLGSKSYCQAIALKPDLSDLWYDLALIYNCMVQVSKTQESKKQIRALACSAVKKSIMLRKNSWESWNLFGIILASKEIQNYYLAQHCFIKAILEKNTNAMTWTNLGTLYLVLDDLQLANQSFTEAQRYDHDYVYCWVGQAMIAQKTGHHDSMDLFRHSTHLGFCGEGCLGYSNLVCLTLLNTKNKNDKNYLYSIKNMNAIIVASNTLTWYTDRYPNNSWAWNMLGLLLERQMLYKGSAEAFCEALKVLQSEEASDKNTIKYSDKMDKVLLNYSRTLSNLKKYEEAIKHLKQIKKATFTNQCELAVTYFKAKLYEEAYASYETTLEWLTLDTTLKSHILVAMAAVVYLHQGQDDAKILLMQSCQLKPPSIEGLFALCALGMLHSDLALSELALRELNQYKDDIKYIGHIAVFQAYIDLFKGQKERAVRMLCKVIHRYPNPPSLWLNLSLLLLHLYPSFDCSSAAQCAEVALITGRSSIDVSKVMSLVSLSNLLSNQGLKSLRSSQKAVHMFPDVTENWIVLVASVLSKCLVRQSGEEITWLIKMISYIRRKFESSKPMTQWLSNNNRKITMIAEKLAVIFLLVVIAVASAGYLSYDEAYFGAGAYGHHGPFAVSYRARVDAPRQDVVALSSVPYAYHY